MNPKVAVQLAKLERMSARERIVVTLCACLACWFLLDNLVVAPKLKDLTLYSQLVETQQGELKNTQTQLENLRSGRMAAGDPALREELSRAEQESLSVNASLRASQQYLVSPAAMSALLHDILRRDTRLELVSLKTLPLSPIIQAQATDKADADKAPAENNTPAEHPADISMYRHGVELVVRGDFLNVLSYLQEVEKLPWQMYWGRFDMQADGNAADARIFRISIYTLSLDKSWLEI